MNKHYDKYLCRKSRFSLPPRNPQGRTKLRLDPPSPPQKRLIKQDVDFKSMFEQGQMDCIKFVFKFYGWVFAGIFALATALFIGLSLK